MTQHKYGPKQPRYAIPDVERLRELAKTMTDGEIAQKLGVHLNTVAKTRWRNGIPACKRKGPGRLRCSQMVKALCVDAREGQRIETGITNPALFPLYHSLPRVKAPKERSIDNTKDQLTITVSELREYITGRESRAEAEAHNNAGSNLNGSLIWRMYELGALRDWLVNQEYFIWLRQSGVTK